MTECPPDDQLRQLLADVLPAERADALSRHINACAACQGRLERLLADPVTVRWRSLLRPVGETAEATRLLPGPEDPDATRTDSAASLLSTRLDPGRTAPAADEGLLRRMGSKSPPPPAPPGYEILGELGRGGMGVVYKARQTTLKRLVALKVIGSGNCARPEEVARFRTEAEAVAQLQHPNIVQIYEIGDYEGRPFFSLEYVEGGSLADRLEGNPLPPRPSAELLHTLALAIHAAHERGIVHRDLKPANILLGNREQGTGNREERDSSLFPVPCSLLPKIADFGLAKRLEVDSGLTHTGTIVGTPSYMAPEQAGGRVHDIGPAADVYSLGALLYHLLTGRPPFNGATALDTLQQVQSQPPVPPTRLQPKVPRDLETICLKCLEKEPHRRYPSALALAEDVRRFLAGEPIRARPATVPERAFKWARRRPAVAALLGVLFGAGLLLLGMGTWSYVRVRASAERAQDRARFAQDVVEDMYTNVAEEWLADEPQKDPLQREFLEKALTFYQKLAQEDDTDPDTRRQVALAWFRVGQLRRTLNQHDEAADAYRRAIALQQRLRDEFPAEPRYRQDLANSFNWLGELLRESGRPPEEAEQNYRTALELQEQLAGDHPDKPGFRRELARSHSNLGLVEMDTERPAEARRDYDRAVDLLEAVVQEVPTNDDFRHELARTRTNRGVLHRQNDRLTEAEADYRRAIDLLEELRGTGRVRTVYKYNLAIAHQDLGNLLWRRRQSDKALAELDRAREILTRLVEDFPARPLYQKKLGRTYNSRGSVLATSGQMTSAEESWTKARDILSDLVERDPGVAEYQSELGLCLGNLGWLKVEQRDLPASRSFLDEAIRHLRLALQPNRKRTDYRETLRNQYQTLAEVLVRSGDRSAAVDAAANLAEVFPDRARGWYYAACFVARCVPLAEKDGAEEAARLAEQAAHWLRQALDLGLTGGERLANEKDIFGPLARRPGFAELLKELESRPRPDVAKAAP
jgi:serine/threonine protein kinase